MTSVYDTIYQESGRCTGEGTWASISAPERGHEGTSATHEDVCELT